MISIVVVIYNMKREAERTFYSLSKLYQIGVQNDYEVIVIDNGSDERLEEGFVKNFGDNFQYYYIENAPSSPAMAVNFGLSKAKGEIVGIIIDGARLVTSGIIGKTEKIFEERQNPVVAVLGYHLGSDLQSKSVLNGYNKDIEDDLLAKIDWKNHPEKLFDVSVFAGSNPKGFEGDIAESNCIFLKKSLYEEIGGMNEKFTLAGGGLVNLDFFKRIVERDDTEIVFLKDEGTFHQLHGGIMSNSFDTEQSINKFKKYCENYREITGKEYVVPKIDIVIY